MASRRIIPCLDVAAGRVVKGIQFQGLRDAGDPVELSRTYEAQGADELVILDVAATPEGRGHAVRTVEAVRAALRIPLTVGGGLRSVEDARRLLDAGADKVAVNTAAVSRPGLLRELADAFGVQCVVLAVDAARRTEEMPPGSGYEVVVRSGRERTGLDVVEWVEKAVSLGAGEILLTSWDRDGTRTGYELDLLRAVAKAVDVPVIASGGADTIAHLQEAVDAGADAVLAASIFHDGQSTVGDVKAELIERGVEIRP
ncbi:MAG: imidazole glycerol phosphate synthase subunit HisF [Myxococcota bacterium]